MLPGGNMGGYGGGWGGPMMLPQMPMTGRPAVTSNLPAARPQPTMPPPGAMPGPGVQPRPVMGAAPPTMSNQMVLANALRGGGGARMMM